MIQTCAFPLLSPQISDDCFRNHWELVRLMYKNANLGNHQNKFLVSYSVQLLWRWPCSSPSLLPFFIRCSFCYPSFSVFPCYQAECNSSFESLSFPQSSPSSRMRSQLHLELRAVFYLITTDQVERYAFPLRELFSVIHLSKPPFLVGYYSNPSVGVTDLTLFVGTSSTLPVRLHLQL
ncbi:hypothetical protein CSKR_200761 [Clonorchis sinensis]|uniref:Uncharacterized protein n=1 Tax=Clonorchis sinensis TaxID=79923 RepID=A0A8T1MH70_CLOSI|nr:hypothetical protein CSKR_200761 [Clonorchis sinensis]